MKAKDLNLVKGSVCNKCGIKFEPDDEVALISMFRDGITMVHKNPTSNEFRQCKGVEVLKDGKTE